MAAIIRISRQGPGATRGRWVLMVLDWVTVYLGSILGGEFQAVVDFSRDNSDGDQ